MDSLTNIIIGLSANLPAAQDIIPLFSVIAFFAGGTFLIVASYRERGQIMARRITTVQMLTGIEGSPSQTGNERLQTTAVGLSNAEHRQLVRMLARYHVDEEDVPTYFTGIRFALAAIAGILVLLFLPLSSSFLSVVAALGAAMIGWFMPVFLVKEALKKHRKVVGGGLPDALELLAICVEAGLSLESGLQRVAQELKLAQPELADELSFTWAEISILPSRDEALENLADRLDLPMVRTVVGTLAQSLRYGSPLAHSLRVAAAEMRTEQLIALEERANRLPALMTIPVMVLIMPTIFLIVGGPAVIRIMDVFAGK